jgi:hypothetical protein
MLHWLAALGLASDRFLITEEQAQGVVAAIDKVLKYHPSWAMWIASLGAATGEGAAWAGLAIILARVYMPMISPKLAATAAPVMAMMQADGQAPHAETADPPAVH